MHFVLYRLLRILEGISCSTFLRILILLEEPPHLTADLLKKKNYNPPKEQHKAKTPTDDLLHGKEVTAAFLGILTLLNLLVLGVGLKSRSKELELEADIW